MRSDRLEAVDIHALSTPAYLLASDWCG